jgi:hypothetical protein
MKRKVTIDKNGYKSTGIWGYVGEQNITDIEIVLPDELVPCDFCIAIITNAGRMELTDKLEIIDGKVNVIVPLSCTAAVGKITVQVVGYVMDESEEIYAIGKTAEFEGKIKPSSTGEIVSDSVHVPLLERIWAKIQSWADKIHTHENKKVLDSITAEKLEELGSGLSEEQAENLAANTKARHTHDNYWSLSDLYCEASEVEQGGNNPFPILPDVVGVDRPTFRGNYLRYDSDGAVINKVDKKEENGSKFFRMYFNKGILDTLFNVPPFLDIPVKEINEKTEIGLNGTGLELDLGAGAGGGLTPEQSADLAANTAARHTHENKDAIDTIFFDDVGGFYVIGGDMMYTTANIQAEFAPRNEMQEYVTAAINGSLDEIEAMIDESGVLDE